MLLIGLFLGEAALAECLKILQLAVVGRYFASHFGSADFIGA